MGERLCDQSAQVLQPPWSCKILLGLGAGTALSISPPPPFAVLTPESATLCLEGTSWTAKITKIKNHKMFVFTEFK